MGRHSVNRELVFVGITGEQLIRFVSFLFVFGLFAIEQLSLYH